MSAQICSRIQGLLLSPIQRASAGKTQSWIALERNHRINVAVHDFEAGDVADGAFKAGVFVAADDERVEIFFGHGLARVFVAAVDFGFGDQCCSLGGAWFDVDALTLRS